MINERLYPIISTFPSFLERSINCIPKNLLERVNEIVLRKNQPVSIYIDNSIFYLGNYGRLYKLFNPDCFRLNSEEMIRIFLNMCNDSVYSYMDNINSGFLTLEGGFRVGISGRFLTRNTNENSIRDISSLSIRIAREYKNISQQLVNVYNKFGIGSTVIIGPPCSGKTTVLRDACRSISSGLIKDNIKVSLLDERGEISGAINNGFLFDIGNNTDVYTNYKKSMSIEMSIRTMAPNVIILDEVLETSEFDEILQGMNSGVDFIFSMHATGLDDLLRKNKFKYLSENATIKYIVVLNNEKKGEIKEVYINEDGSNIWNTVYLNSCGDNIKKSGNEKTFDNKGFYKFAS
ncbi:MAG: hypothetical protein PUD72_00380 [Oscillospiraceae bacterium]|nr:hypothetical protein [Oscillospiraceae bacterium]